MNHDFIPNPNKPEFCIDCGYPEIKHGDQAVCDCCDKTGNLQHFLLGNKSALLTRDCMEREKAQIEKEINDPSSERHKHFVAFQSEPLQEKRLLEHNAIVQPYNQLIADSRKIDEQLNLSSDIFTAKTISIEDIRKSIWADDRIEPNQKFFTFVAECKRRILNFQSKIFDLDKAKIEAYSEQKAWHVAMNDYANKLTREERESLKIADISYKPETKPVKAPKQITLKKNKATKEEIRNATKELNLELGSSIPEYMIQMKMNAGMSLDDAIIFFRRTIKVGVSEHDKSVESVKE